MSVDPIFRTHQEWLGYLQPVGVVLSPHVLANRLVAVDRNFEVHRDYFQVFKTITSHLATGKCTPGSFFSDLARNVFGWNSCVVLSPEESHSQFSNDFSVSIPEFETVLTPSRLVFSPSSTDASKKPILLVFEAAGDFDAVNQDSDWHASAQSKFERLLRDTEVGLGLLINSKAIRLVYTPRGEASGYLSFPFEVMSDSGGQLAFSAFRTLLGEDRLVHLPENERLPALLAESRKYQNTVSTKLAEQVLAALYELAKGFQAARNHASATALEQAIKQNPDRVGQSLLTILLRMIFLLYAEDRSLLPTSPLFIQNYSLLGLFESLRDDAGRFPDTMSQRYGAWGRFLAICRLVHEGSENSNLRFVAKKGYLFEPNRFPFLEARSGVDDNGKKSLHVSDEVIYKVLENLLMIDGERISYRSLDVEQIGSVYESIMGFELRIAEGDSVALKHPKGAPVFVSLDEILATTKRKERIKEFCEVDVTDTQSKALKDAKTQNDVVVALKKRLHSALKENIFPKGSLILQPTDERRRTGSHYTPRSLTLPIVEKALRPHFQKLGSNPTPAQILDLKVCDPAMGSGAFLVEACRQLADALVRSWRFHKCTPPIPADEDEVLLARRTIVRRCIYGVDKNPIAVDLSKLSLWLTTYARDHDFAFLDHALRCGDSLVGLSKAQIAAGHWDIASSVSVQKHAAILGTLNNVGVIREIIRNSADDTQTASLEKQMESLDEDLRLVRFIGDTVIAAFFAGSSDKERNGKVETAVLKAYDATSDESRFEEAISKLEKELEGDGSKPIRPFHWEIEFPEVFNRTNPGFDIFIGNPPFLGGKRISETQGDIYNVWLAWIHVDSNKNADLVAHFFRRCFTLSRCFSTLGLIATNTIAQGDTRSAGLRWICTNGGVIYSANRRTKWPGFAAVIVSVIHIIKSGEAPFSILDERPVKKITAFLFSSGGNEDAKTLRENSGKSFIGSYVLGMGFTFSTSSDSDLNSIGTPSPISLMKDILIHNPRSSEVIFPYIGGEEVTTCPSHSYCRHVINFEERTEEECRQHWPELMDILEKKVKPERLTKDVKKYPRMVNEWWKFWNARSELYKVISEQKSAGVKRFLFHPNLSVHSAWVFLSNEIIVGTPHNVITLYRDGDFCILQSRIHEVWSRFFGSSLEDRLRYTPTDCFETFPFPVAGNNMAKLDSAGKSYYDFRATLMVNNNEGLTDTYNRFHDPNETSCEILELRKLHGEMDLAVLAAYGWDDLNPTCGFVLDYLDFDEDISFSPEVQKRIEDGEVFFADVAEASAFNAEVRAAMGGRKKLPWRYRWPDDVRDEILARLLALNAERYEQEQLSGAAAAGAKKTVKKSGTRKKKSDAGNSSDDSTLF